MSWKRAQSFDLPLEEDDCQDKGSQRQRDPAVQRLREQETIPQLTAASHIFCLTESKVGYWFIQLG